MQKYGENYIILTHTNNILLEKLFALFIYLFICLWSNTEVNLKVQNGHHRCNAKMKRNIALNVIYSKFILM